MLYTSVVCPPHPAHPLCREPTNIDTTRGANLTAGHTAFSESSMCASSACRFMSKSLSRDTKPGGQHNRQERVARARGGRRTEVYTIFERGGLVGNEREEKSGG